ncbi:MAG: histidine kinase [Longicatena sp.]
MKKRLSLKQRMFLYSSLLIIVSVFILFSYNTMTAKTVSQFENSFEHYQKLNGFYKNIDFAHDSMKSYLYEKNNKKYEEFKNFINDAYYDANYLIQNYTDKNTTWNFILLRNMLDTYYTKSLSTKNIFDSSGNSENYKEHYGEFLNIQKLINSTSDHYYEIITIFMSKQNAQLISFQKKSELYSIIISIALILWIALFTALTIKSITSPLYKIIDNINNIKKGNYNLNKVSNTGKEMETLCLALNEMASSVKNNIVKTTENAFLEKKLLEKENENLKKDELLAQSELRLLQNQINPHFLFNTMNMIYKKAYLDDCFEIAEMIEKTASLLRYGIETQNRKSDILSEVEATNDYIWIQNRRLKNRIHISFSVSENINNIQIPSVILQPLIENSIQYSLQTCLKDGEINVSIIEKPDSFIFSVTDNGTGIKSSTLEALMLDEFKPDVSDISHLSIINIIKRLETIYGNQVKISVNSHENCGFETIICIYKSEDKNHV